MRIMQKKISWDYGRELFYDQKNGESSNNF